MGSFTENTLENIDDVVMGAHLLLKKFIDNNKKKLDKILIKRCERAIGERERRLNTAFVQVNEVHEERSKEVNISLKIPSYLNEWTKTVLKCLVIGFWNIYRRYLPSKNRSMIVNKVKSMLKSSSLDNLITR